MIRLMEVLLDTGVGINGWSARHIHEVLLGRFRISAEAYTLNQLRYDLRKMKAHGFLQRLGGRYAYGLTEKGIRIAFLFRSFISGSLARWLTASLSGAPINSISPTASSSAPTGALMQRSIRLSSLSEPREYASHS